MPIIQGQILEGSTVHTDGRKAYDGLIVNGYDHYRVFHCENEFARGKSHVNGIEAFWSFAKRRLAKFNGCNCEKFVLHLKECQFRFNHRNENLQNIIKQITQKIKSFGFFDIWLAAVVGIVNVKSLVRTRAISANIPLFAVGMTIFGDSIAAAKGIM